jgi:hypothetical protein
LRRELEEGCYLAATPTHGLRPQHSVVPQSDVVDGEALVSKKWERMTKNEKLDLLRDEVDKLTRRIEDSLPTAKKAKKSAKKKGEDGEPPFST